MEGTKIHHVARFVTKCFKEARRMGSHTETGRVTCYTSYSRGRVFEAVGGAIMAGLDVCIRITYAAYSVCLTERGISGVSSRVKRVARDRRLRVG